MKLLVTICILVSFAGTALSCGKGFTLINDKCYKLDRTLGTFDQNSKRCSNLGGYLASIQSAAEAKAVVRVLPKAYKKPVFVGGFKLDDGWHWGDSMPFLFKNWAKGQPGKRGNCITINADKDVTAFVSAPCHGKFAAICSLPKKGVFPPSRYTQLKKNGKCPDFYPVRIGDMCYVLFSGERQSFNGAKQRCLHFGGWLPSVNSHKEAQKLADIIMDDYKTPIWVGLYRNTDKSSWYWADFSWFTYADWAKGQPGKDGDCVAVNTDWNSHKDRMAVENCTKKMPFICYVKVSNFGYAYAG